MVSEKECICERGREMKEKDETLRNMEIGKEFLGQIQENKTEKEYWNQFFQTGRIQDYLNYVQYSKRE